MSLCNVEFYDHQFNYIFNDSIDSPEIDEDYLSPAESTITLGKIVDIPVNGLVYIDSPFNFLGIVTAVDSQDYTTEIHFQPFITIFNQPVLFNTNWQGKPNGMSLEAAIENLIVENWINLRPSNNDPYQVLQYLHTDATITTTKNWGFNLKSDNEDQHYCIVNLYDVVICGALMKYGIVLTPVVNRNTKTVTIRIEKTSGQFYINADMNNVKINTFMINDLGSVTNKLEIWSSDGYGEVAYYYLHPDGTYDTNNTDRIEPVRLNVVSVAPRDGDDGEPIDFEDLAAEQAASEFENIDPVTNIELEVLFNDELVKPTELLYGQTVLLIHDGYVYTTYLTGRRYGSIVTLLFGKSRADLTKKLRIQTNLATYSDKFINYRSATDTRTGFDTSVIGTRNYKALTNKPVLNGVTINNNQSLGDIGINTIANSEIEAIVNN